ncbi:aldose epimerase family protein [Acuticoccus sp. MNP-M23]|uniref:aldose epimerase family protein n=1 Tax=Acuticoccus sp. MNP-M23 TaxID=3072793 RepID=UPI002815B437|nr:aldose epimerase family protein [Acuticoccus sp. MNP-M23]WMS42591.1 aldose epimerase family protein [Acuticoccus sp. MNP-M23]
MKTFGTIGGKPVYEATLTDGDVAISVLSHGATMRDWRVPDATGKTQSVILGFDDIGPYTDNKRSFGILAGRIANRVRDGRFTMDGTTYQLDQNQNGNHLHGGSDGIGRQHWTMEEDGKSVRLTLKSPDGAMGYPGNVDFTYVISLDGHTVTFDITAVPDRPTPIAPAEHNYYRLGAPLAEHVMTIPAGHTTAVDDGLIPTGELAPVDGTPLDFRQPKKIGDQKIDDNFCLDGAPACRLETDAYVLTMTTDRPGLQVFSGFTLPQFETAGHDGIVYGPFAGVALEAQNYPDTVNNPSFGNIIATPDKPYRQTTSVTIVPAATR